MPKRKDLIDEKMSIFKELEFYFDVENNRVGNIRKLLQEGNVGLDKVIHHAIMQEKPDIVTLVKDFPFEGFLSFETVSRKIVTNELFSILELLLPYFDHRQKNRLLINMVVFKRFRMLDVVFCSMSGPEKAEAINRVCSSFGHENIGKMFQRNANRIIKGETTFTELGSFDPLGFFD